LESADQEIDLELGAAAFGIRIQSGHDVTALDAELTGTYTADLVTRAGIEPATL
jgi:hypothetical protein